MLLKGLNMKYLPNFNDPRVLSRTRHAFGFTRAVMSIEKSTPWSTRVIDKYFGKNSDSLGKYLRGMLLICTNNNYSMDTGKCKEYKINEKGLDLIRNILLGNKDIVQLDSIDNDNNLSHLSYPSVRQVGETSKAYHLFDNQLIKEFCMREYGEQLRSLDFTYEDKSHRLWNPIQNIRKETKNSLLAENGLIYNYDIECCAPTLILMHSQHHGNKEWLEALNDYLCYKEEIRMRVSNELELPVKQVKILINALFCGARIGNNNQLATYHLLAGDESKITWVKEDPYMTELRDNIKTCWKYIEPHYPQDYIITKNSQKRKSPMSSKLKWNIYFQQERLVLNEVSQYLQSKGNKFFLEHDGFVTQQEINKEELFNLIRKNTGYGVNFQLEVYNNLSPLIP